MSTLKMPGISSDDSSAAVKWPEISASSFALSLPLSPARISDAVAILRRNADELFPGRAANNLAR